VKFDKEYAYGDTQEEFKKVAIAAISQPELIVAEVPIQGLIYIVYIIVSNCGCTCISTVTLFLLTCCELYTHTHTPVDL